MKDEVRRLLMKEIKKAGGDKSKVAARVKQADTKFDTEQRQAETNAKNLRLAEDRKHFSDLLNNIRVMPSFDAQLSKAFPPLDNSPIKQDDGYVAFIGCNIHHVVNHQFNTGKIGTWRNAGSIQAVEYVSIFGYRKDGIGNEEHLAALLELARRFNPVAAIHVSPFDNNGKFQYETLAEIKADIASVLGKLYNLPVSINKDHKE